MTRPDELPLWFVIPVFILLIAILVVMWLRDRKVQKELAKRPKMYIRSGGKWVEVNASQDAINGLAIGNLMVGVGPGSPHTIIYDQDADGEKKDEDGTR